jgi:D-glycero-beta-D-manno-heptose-7-phosphate kinase
LIDSGKLDQLFKTFRGIKALIIGDVMVDAYLYGKVDRISPEAPVPVVSLARRVNMLGGAANVALNIKTLGAIPLLFSVIGEDLKGREFLDMMHREGIGSEGIIRSPERITTTKFRIIGNNNQMLRVDEENVNNLSAQLEVQLLENIRQTLQEQQVHVIVFQDYDKGVITKNIILGVMALAAEKQIPVAVDPKRRNFATYRGARLFKPNLKELREGMKADFPVSDKNALQESMALLQERAEHEIVMVTLSDEGIVARFKTDGRHMLHSQPAFVRTISDVSGAGDTVISVASICVALDVKPPLMAFLANLAGGIVCEYVGVVPIDIKRLKREANEFSAKTK